jgi:site-specific DNA recombinase
MAQSPSRAGGGPHPAAARSPIAIGRARARVEARMDATRRRLAGRAATRTLATLPAGERALREAWETRGLSWRRAVLAAVVERVVLHPCLKGRNVFDPSRIEVVWRT